MKSLYLLTTALTAFAANTFAAMITLDGTGNREMFQLGSTTPVAAGSEVLIGYFAGLTDAQIISHQHDPAYLESMFVSFGLSGAVGQGAQGAAGYFTIVTSASVEAPNATFTAPSAPNNSQIYIWVFDSNTSPLAATQQAIFTSTDVTWNWPVSDDGSTDRMISPDNNLSMLVGTIDSGEGGGVHLQAMPEPGSCVLLAIGLVGFLGARPKSTRTRLARMA
jgi:hypothetical protein